MAAARRFQRRANLDRMMAIIIDQRDVVDDALDVEPPAHAGKLLEPGANQIRGHIQIQRHGRRRGGIAHIMDSRGAIQMKLAEVVAAIASGGRCSRVLGVRLR